MLKEFFLMPLFESKDLALAWQEREQELSLFRPE
jgi:hypothetical protein